MQPTVDIASVRTDTPLGPVVLRASGRGITSLSFSADATETASDNPHLSLAVQELKEYFAGSRKQFEVSLDLQGSDFQKRVWTSLLRIPFGQTTTYGQQARVLGDPRAVRAVASANGANPVAIVVPCHRVIGSNGRLTGYAGGLERKRWLLEFEQKNSGLYL
ncbi:MAG: methylated-DNA--[protein]-cysteine S-methyltransferase [Bacteroidales bacterium]